MNSPINEAHFLRTKMNQKGNMFWYFYTLHDKSASEKNRNFVSMCNGPRSLNRR